MKKSLIVLAALVLAGCYSYSGNVVGYRGGGWGGGGWGHNNFVNVNRGWGGGRGFYHPGRW